ncbi:MAG TPA: hypothetical protein VJV78_34490 [Polyangiales bacterium]|nr:hypothetical protein [Polyangiales bacterium]
MIRNTGATWLLALALVACGGNDDDPVRGGAGGREVARGAAGMANLPAGTGGSAAGSVSPAGRGGAGTIAAGTGAAGVTAGSGMAGMSAGPAGTGGGTVGLPSGTLAERIGTSEVALPAGIKPGVRNWRVWTLQMLKISPIFSVPLANCGTLIGFTTGTSMAPNARVVRLDANDKLVATIDLGASLELRGLAAEPDGHFGALLWNGASDQIWVKRYDLMGKELFATELVNKKNDMIDNSPTDFGIGESRLEFGAGKYGAYYHVHSMSGHEGDTLKYVAAETGAEMTTWPWGCSHSMSNLLTFNPTSSTFLASCVTDCYPGTSGSDFATTAKGGVYTENRYKIMDVAGGCNGTVAGELGGAAAAPAGWKVVFNAHQQPTVLGQKSYSTMTMNQDIGFISIGANKMPMGGVVWLTTTPMIQEADSAIVRFAPMGDSAEQYIVGWLEGSAYKMARVDPTGKFLEQPSDVTSKAKWGQRDDPFRAHKNGDIVWAWADAANAQVLKFARLRSGNTAECAAF